MRLAHEYRRPQPAVMFTVSAKSLRIRVLSMALSLLAAAPVGNTGED